MTGVTTVVFLFLKRADEQFLQQEMKIHLNVKVSSSLPEEPCCLLPVSRHVRLLQTDAREPSAEQLLTLIVSFSGRWLRLAPKSTVECSVSSCDHVWTSAVRQEVTVF